jgi:hypothetical protein
MIKRVLSLAVAVACTLLAVQMVGADWAEVDEKMKEAESLLGKRSEEGTEVERAFKLMMEAIALASPGTTYTSEFGQNVDKAKTLFEAKSIVNPDGVAHLRKAYRQIHEGRNFEMPSQISSVEDAVQYGMEQLAAARKDLKAGKTDECVRRLVEITVMVVTPMHKHP